MQPDALIGHSIGEYAAACVAGVFDFEDAFKLVAMRGRLMEQATPPGKMCVVFASSLTVVPLLAGYRGEVEIAADAAPTTVVISGRSEAVDAVVAELGRRTIDTRHLNVSRAFHSPLMEPMLEAFRAVATSIRYSAPKIKLVSSVTGRFESSLFEQPDYWVDHVRKTVQFKRGMDQLIDAGSEAFLEVGPGKGTLSLARSCYQTSRPGQTASWLHSFDRKQDECAQLLGALAELYEAGVDIDWSAYERWETSDRQCRSVSLPRYPLDRASYWVCERSPADQAVSRRSALIRREPEDATLLGRELDLPALRERRFESRLGASALQVLRDHKVGTQVVFPAAGFLAIAMQAAKHIQQSAVELQDVSFGNPLLLVDGRPVCVSTTLRDAGTARARFEIYSASNDAPGERRERSEHCTGELLTAGGLPSSRNLEEFRALCTESLPVEEFYRRFSAAGLEYSGRFRFVRAISKGNRIAIAEIAGDAKIGSFEHDPALLDCCLQTIAAALWDEGIGSLHLPLGVQRLWIAADPPPDYLWCCVEVRQIARLITADLLLFDASGTLFASLAGFQLAPVDLKKFGRSTAVGDGLVYDLGWDPLPAGALDAAADEALECLLVASAPSAVNEIAGQLNRPGVAVYSPDEAATMADCKSALQQYARMPQRSSERVLVYVWPEELEPDATRFARAYEDFRQFWKALHEIDWAGSQVCVCVLTRAGQRIEGLDTSIRPGHAAAWGLARSLMHESPGTRMLLIDLPRESGHGAQSILPCIAHGMRSTEAQFAVRGNVVLVPRLRERSPDRSAKQEISAGTYLVTGGSGAIGTQIVEWLIGKRAHRILSLSRRLPDHAEQQRLLGLIGDRRINLEFVAADVCSVDDLACVIDRVQGTLKGVFHAAGQLEDGLLVAQEPSASASVLAPKIAGVLNLHRCTAHLPLDLFVCFSSIVSCVGSPGQTAYAAANAYMDAVAWLRTDAGLAAHVMNWGPWAGRGMAARLGDQQRARIKASGVGELDPLEAMAIFESLVGRSVGQSLIWQVDAAALLGQAASSGVGAMFQHLRGARPPSATVAANVRSEDYVAQLRALNRSDMEAEIQRHLLERLAETLDAVPRRSIRTNRSSAWGSIR